MYMREDGLINYLKKKKKIPRGTSKTQRGGGLADNMKRSIKGDIISVIGTSAVI